LAPRRAAVPDRPAPADTQADLVWAGLPPGSRIFVDTAPLIYLLESHPVLADRFVGLFEAAAEGRLSIVISTITIAEVLTGPCKAGQTALAHRYEKALCEYEVVGVSVTVATLAARLRARYRLRLPDAMQLAAALDCGAGAFVTHDWDFSGVDAIPILTGG
jgi:predicted nucleic acid-binding protein